MRVAIYGDTADLEITGFIAALTQQCSTLGIALNTEFPAAGLATDLSLVFARNSITWTPAQNLQFAALVKDAHLVLPVIDTPADATCLPAALGGLNAFKKSDTGTAWCDSLVDETLGMAWLKRRTRKVFISYRRIDSSPVAGQLFDRFSELGYEVFLDDASIPRGVDFQRELMWWLNDADLMLLLGSPRFSDSPWCLKEINFAQSNTIGIVALLWPLEVYGPNASVPFDGKLGWPEPVLLKVPMADQTLRLGMGDFTAINAGTSGPNPDPVSRKLTPAALQQALALCARNRARAIRARLNQLLPLVKHTLTRQGATSLTQTFQDITFRNSAGKLCFVRVLPFRPGPEHILQAYNEGKGHFLAACAYAESDLKDARAEALRWMAEKNQTILKPGSSNSALWAFCGDAQL